MPEEEKAPTAGDLSKLDTEDKESQKQEVAQEIIPVEIIDMAIFSQRGDVKVSKNNFIMPDKEWTMNLPTRMSVGLDANDVQMNIDDVRNTIHVVMQSKGGAGKTYVAAVLASFFQRHAKALPLHCFDLDSTNKHSFSAFKALKVQRLSDINDENLDTDSTRFDAAFNLMLEPATPDGIVVMDTGASSYVSVLKYLLDTDYPSLAALSDKPWRFILHVVVSAADVKDCEASLEYMSKKITSPYVEYVMWGNEFFGNLDEFYANNMLKYAQFFSDKNLLLPPVDAKNLLPHLKNMRESGLTATEIMESKKLTPIERARVKQYFYGNSAGKGGVFAQLFNVDWKKPEQEQEQQEDMD